MHGCFSILGGTCPCSGCPPSASWNCKMWEKMILSDESTFCLFATRPIRVRVRRFPGEEFKPECLNLTVKHLMKIMIRTAKEYDMKVNIKKTKVMKVSRKGEGIINITIDGEIY